jgi:NADP-dependent 3-hydroxy acid dehydrogenase YdfG
MTPERSDHSAGLAGYGAAGEDAADKARQRDTRASTVRRNILITGASSGLGAGMARIYASRGHTLALCARRIDRLESLRDELLAAHPDATVAVRRLDVTDHAQVFRVFREFDDELGGVDRVIVNAGLGKGASIGTGRFEANRQTVDTNVTAALAQCEAAMEIFRRQHRGHLVVMSSVSAWRGGRGALTTYAASKAFVASLAEGIRSDVLETPIKVTTLHAGFIESEMTAQVRSPPFIVSAEKGCKALVAAIEGEPAAATVPGWPWRPITAGLRVLPLRLVRKVM